MLAGLSGAQFFENIAKLGLTPEQLKTSLANGTGKEVLIRLLACCCPLLLKSVISYVRGEQPTSNNKDRKWSHEVDTQPLHAAPELIRQIEDKAPGLMDIFAQQVQTALGNK